MARTFIRQDAQIASTGTSAVGFLDNISPSLANYETNATDIAYDLNTLRSQLQNFLNRNGASFPSGNWYDDITQPTTLENGTQRGIDAVNDALHLVEKKRILRNVWKILDVGPGLDLAITLVNDLKTQYEAHRVLTAGSVHGAADTTNVVGSPDATSLATAITLANEIKTDYEAHRILTAGSVHGAADNTNAVTAADSTDLDSLITLVNDLRTQYEAHRVYTVGGVHGAADTTNVVTASAVASTVQVHILTAAQLPSQTTAAIGVVTTKGTVCAEATTFGAAGLDEVAGTTSVAPKNLVPLVDGDTRDPILVGGKVVWGLFQSESATDGSTLSGTTPNRAQFSFVVINDTGDDLELTNLPTTTIFQYASRERVSFEDLSEQDFLNGAVVDVPSATTVTRQVGYDNQGTTPVNVTTNSFLDLEGPGLTWEIRDDLEASLFKIIEGSAGGTSTVQLGSDVDSFDVNAVDVDFNAGISVRSGGTRPIDIGVNDGIIESTAGALEVQATTTLSFDDGNKPAGWSLTEGIHLSDAAQEWTDLEANAGGEVSLIQAINLAYSNNTRTKVQATLTSNVTANNDVNGPSYASNTDVDLAPYDSVPTSFVQDVEVFLNGELLRNNASSGANDVYPGTSPAQGDLKFTFNLIGTGSRPDQITVIVNGQ